jgi:signal transduction histidine kinase
MNLRNFDMKRNSLSFKTRARTIDHLGREQIADCPTSISELWKNAFDAYATKAELHLFDGDVDVAGLFDNGHGMNKHEFETKWLTIGTESKTDGHDIPEADRNGLPARPKQGQKGIGRLSCAAIGPLLLLISKRKYDDYVVSLIDWRLFENPYLYLNDIVIPMTEITNIHDLSDALPAMYDELMSNVWGDATNPERTSRIVQAWKEFTEVEKNKGLAEEDTTQRKIESSLIEDIFNEKHYQQCDLWKSTTAHGTAMFMAHLHDDLKAQLGERGSHSSNEVNKKFIGNFFQTLSGFVDPFNEEYDTLNRQFQCRVIAWKAEIPFDVLSDEKQIDFSVLQDIEHIVDGEVDEEGYFRGRIKAYGKWYDNCVIKPNSVYKMRRDSRFGPFKILCGSFELTESASSLAKQQHAFFFESKDIYGGLRVYRDQLRVLPYGRSDSDYFDMEHRRGQNAGRYFWAHRKTFGRILISRKDNPNLKDKAGREGIIDNRASKLFREVVENILIKSADQYFGRKSELREKELSKIREEKALEKAQEDTKILQNRERKRIRTSLKKDMPKLIEHVKHIERFRQQRNSQVHGASPTPLEELQALKSEVDVLTQATKGFSLSPVPPNLGRLEQDYRHYRQYERKAHEILNALNLVINQFLETSKQKTDYEKAQEVYRSKSAKINSAITSYKMRGSGMLTRQLAEFASLVDECRKQYKNKVEEDLEDLRLEKKTFSEVIKTLDEEKNNIEIEQAQLLLPYISALESTQQQLDLEGLAIHNLNETQKYKKENERLHSLAQLGVTVEIVGHEFEGLNLTIRHGIKELIDSSLSERQQKSLSYLEHAHHALMDKIRFLSPLKLSGKQKLQEITGHDIAEYIMQYFQKSFERANIQVQLTDQFKGISLLDFPSRIFPVFINLIHNSIYWVQNSGKDQLQIMIDKVNDEIVIADNGLGIDEDDLPHLFSLFFTRKQVNGRGVGLYLSKQNLSMGGHHIKYETRDTYKLLPGANFSIKFQGLSNAK